MSSSNQTSAAIAASLPSSPQRKRTAWPFAATLVCASLLGIGLAFCVRTMLPAWALDGGLFLPKRRLFERKFAGLAAGRAHGRLKRPGFRTPKGCAVSSTREGAPSTVRKPHVLSPGPANESKIVLTQIRAREKKWGDFEHEQPGHHGKRSPLPHHRVAVPPDRGLPAGSSCSLLAQAREWEHRAVAELEAYYEAFCSAASGNAQPASYAA